MVRPILTRSLIYEAVGRLLITVGIALFFLLGLRLARDDVDRQIADNTNYLFIASTPVFELPPATPLPTFTPTPIPTATPLPLPAIRLSIPAINLNTGIKELFPTEQISSNGENKFVWEPPAFIAGHYNSSGNPGGGSNIVLTGHNNTLGDIFRDLDQLNEGDEVILFTESGEYHYQVLEKIIVPYLGAETEGEATLQSLSAPQSSEMVTLLSCWPYFTNANRIVIIAVPLSNGSENDQ